VLLPAVKLCNLLPIDINYKLSGEKGCVVGGSNAAITNVSLDQGVWLVIKYWTCRLIWMKLSS
jgi:hypothetical protein